MEKKEVSLSNTIKLDFVEKKLFDRAWHLKVLMIIFSGLFVIYVLLKLFLK